MSTCRVQGGNSKRMSLLVFCALIVILLPRAFLGFDFIDSGYHFVNQLNVLRFHDFLYVTGYYWLSDLIGGFLLLLFPIWKYTAFRIIGVFAWAGIGVFAYRLLSRWLHYAGDFRESRILAVSCVIGVCLSTRQHASFLMADYYVIPIFVVLATLWFLIGVYFERRTNDILGAVSCLSLMPLFRWPLLVEATALWIALFAHLCIVRNTHRHRVGVGLIVFIIALVVYKLYFLDVVMARNTVPADYVTWLINLYWTDLTDKLLTGVRWWLPVLLISITAYRKPGFRPSAILLIIVGLVALLFIRDQGQHKFFLKNHFSEILTFIIWMTAFVYLLIRGLEAKKPKEVGAVVCLGIVVGAYHLGTDTGIDKTSYLAFLVVAPALYFLSRSLNAGTQRKLFLSSLLIISIAHLYKDVYQDDLMEILRRPSILSSRDFGVVVTTKENVAIEKDFVTLLPLIDSPNSEILIGPHSPTLYAFTPGIDFRYSWVELKPEKKIAELLAKACASGGITTIIVPRLNLGEVKKSVPKISSMTEIAWTESCGGVLKLRTTYFNVFKVLNKPSTL